MGNSVRRLAELARDPVPFLSDDDAAVRRLAVSGCNSRVSEEAVFAKLVGLLCADPSPQVRAAAAEVVALAGESALDPLRGASSDPDPIVVEAVATAFGELGEASAVPWLSYLAQRHEDKLVREAAVAALGAIGDPTAVPLLIDLLRAGPPQVRRRCVVALAAFEVADMDQEIEAALRAAVEDRNPMVREAAEMVVGRSIEWEPITLEPRAGKDPS